MALYEVPTDYRIALVATMPRSGTWYSFYFLEFLDLFLSGRTDLNTRLDLHVYHGLKMGKLHTHCICPGFLQSCNGPRRKAWDALEFYTPGFNYGYGRFIEGNEQVFSPLQNSEVRIIYFYRNPLDQMVSFHRHIQRHRQESARTYQADGGSEASFENLRHYIEAGGLESYIKQYLTFHFMANEAPRNLLMLPYERLIGDPPGTFRDMLDFLQLQVEDASYNQAFDKALNASTPQSLRNLEKSLGASLGRDQKDDRESHLRGGQVGKWRSYVNPADHAYVEEQMRSFGLDLSAFTLDPMPAGEA